MRIDPNDPRITAYALGELEPSERVEIEKVFAESPETRALVEEIRSTAQLLSEELREDAAVSLSRHQHRAIEKEIKRQTHPNSDAKGWSWPLLLQWRTGFALSFALCVLILGTIYWSPMTERAYQRSQEDRLRGRPDSSQSFKGERVEVAKSAPEKLTTTGKGLETTPDLEQKVELSETAKELAPARRMAESAEPAGEPVRGAAAMKEEIAPLDNEKFSEGVAKKEAPPVSLETAEKESVELDDFVVDSDDSRLADKAQPQREAESKARATGLDRAKVVVGSPTAIAVPEEGTESKEAVGVAKTAVAEPVTAPNSYFSAQEVQPVPLSPPEPQEQLAEGQGAAVPIPVQPQPGEASYIPVQPQPGEVTYCTVLPLPEAAILQATEEVLKGVPGQEPDKEILFERMAPWVYVNYQEVNGIPSAQFLNTNSQRKTPWLGVGAILDGARIVAIDPLKAVMQLGEATQELYYVPETSPDYDPTVPRTPEQIADAQRQYQHMSAKKFMVSAKSYSGRAPGREKSMGEPLASERYAQTQESLREMEMPVQPTPAERDVTLLGVEKREEMDQKGPKGGDYYVLDSQGGRQQLADSVVDLRHGTSAAPETLPLGPVEKRRDLSQEQLVSGQGGLGGGLIAGGHDEALGGGLGGLGGGLGAGKRDASLGSEMAGAAEAPAVVLHSGSLQSSEGAAPTQSESVFRAPLSRPASGGTDRDGSATGRRIYWGYERHEGSESPMIGYIPGIAPLFPREEERAEPLEYPGTEGYGVIAENPFKIALQEPLSTFSIDVDTASYANVRRFLNQGQLPPKDAVRIEEMVNYFDYDYKPPTEGGAFSARVEFATCPWNADHRLVRIGIKGKEIPGDDRPACNLVFLLDVSGSMKPVNKLPLVKQGMKLLLNRLDDNDHVAIVTYAGSSGVALESTSCKEKSTITSAIDNLNAGGSTNGAAGIEDAYRIAEKNFIKGGINRVVLATDGDFNVGITDNSDLVQLIQKKAKSGIFLSVLGFGMGNLKDDKLEILADKGNGNYAYIDNLREAQKVLVEQIGSTLVTIAKDVKIQVEFHPAKVGAYRLIGYENRQLAAQDFNDDTKDAGEIGAGHTVTALYELIPQGKPLTPGVDALRYQKPPTPPQTDLVESPETLTVKIRYKEPDDDTSTLIEIPVTDLGVEENLSVVPSEDFRFAASVAAFGMTLRDSRYKGAADFDTVLELARAGKGADKNGYRAEFIQLVNLAKALKGE